MKVLMVSFSDSETNHLTRASEALYHYDNNYNFILLALDNIWANDHTDSIPPINQVDTNTATFYSHYSNLNRGSTKSTKSTKPTKGLNNNVVGNSLADRTARLRRRLINQNSSTVRSKVMLELLDVLRITYKSKVSLSDKAKELIYNSKRLYSSARWGFYRVQLALDSMPWLQRVRHRRNYLFELRRVRYSVKAIKSFFNLIQPDVILLAKDSAYYDTTIYVKVAQEMGIRAVLLPYDRADSDMLFADRKHHFAHKINNKVSRYVAKKHGKWVMSKDGYDLLLSPPSTILALDRHKISPENPWVYNYTKCDLVLVEDDADIAYFVDHGFEMDKLKKVGAPYMDEINKAHFMRGNIKNNLIDSGYIDTEKPIVVASIPPDKIAQRRLKLEYEKYSQLVKEWGASISNNTDANIFFSLHPLTSLAKVKPILSEYGYFTNQKLAELIVIADLYVVDCSATSRWAVYYGLPVIDYDVYSYNIKFNSKISGVTLVNDKSQFAKELSKWRSSYCKGNKNNDFESNSFASEADAVIKRLVN